MVYKVRQNWSTTFGPPVIGVELVRDDATAKIWRIIVFEVASANGHTQVAEILEAGMPWYWINRMKLPEDTKLHDDISSIDTGRARKLSTKVERICMVLTARAKQKELM